jgi:hypothetical protein
VCVCVFVCVRIYIKVGSLSQNWQNIFVYMFLTSICGADSQPLVFFVF